MAAINRYILVDIGNTSIKVRVASGLQDDQWLEQSSTICDNDNWEIPTLAQLGEVPDSQTAWLVASVNGRALTRMCDLIKTTHPSAICYPIRNEDVRHPELPFRILPENKSAIGTDRLLAAVGAIDRFHKSAIPSDRPDLVVIDAGTAVTVDAIDREGNFWGGTIQAGIHLQRRALHMYTDVLPDLSSCPDKLPAEIIGSSTEFAILAGTGYGALDAVAGVAERVGRRMADLRKVPFNPAESRVVLTGGDADVLGRAAPAGWIVQSDLVLHGLRVTAQCLSFEDDNDE